MLSDLEAAALGVIWKQGPCTAYAVRKHFRESPSSHWSASAGAIYPLIHRLVERGYLASADLPRGRRPSASLQVTKSGRAAFRAWIGPPVSAHVASQTFDALRTRALFLGVLTPQRRERWLADAENALREHRRRIEESHAAGGADEDEWFELAYRSSIRETRARLAWIREARELSAARDRG